MSTAEDRFIAGEGALAALLRAQPVFEAPPRMFGRVLAALEAAPTTDGFEPPARLLEAVMAEAERIDAAQAPRREALMAELAAGKAAEEVLGAGLSPATSQWLATRRPKSAASPPPRRQRRPWLAGLGTAVTAALAIGVVLHVMQEPPAPPPMPAARTAPAPAAPRADAVAESTAGAADTDVALAPREQAGERLADAEAAPARTARVRENVTQAREARRMAPASPAAAPPATTMADDAPGAAAASPAMAKAVAGAPAANARIEAESDEATAPGTLFDVALDTPPARLAARLLARPAQAWTLSFAPADEAAAKDLRASLIERLEAAGRDDPVEIRLGTVTPGRIRVAGSQ